jgi:hypothetical protein
MTTGDSGHEVPVGPNPELSSVVVPLLKGVVYRADNPALWGSLLGMLAGVRDCVAVLGLELTVDESEGFAFLRTRQDQEDDDVAGIPRLVARRQLSYPVSLLLALLRRKLAESDAGGGDTRLILSRDEIVELIRIFLPEGSNESKLTDKIDATLAKVAELGFIRRLRTQGHTYEVRRIIKAYVDAQWLADFDARLAAYREPAAQPLEGSDG